VKRVVAVTGLALAALLFAAVAIGTAWARIYDDGLWLGGTWRPL